MSSLTNYTQYQTHLAPLPHAIRAAVSSSFVHLVSILFNEANFGTTTEKKNEPIADIIMCTRRAMSTNHPTDHQNGAQQLDPLNNQHHSYHLWNPITIGSIAGFARALSHLLKRHVNKLLVAIAGRAVLQLE